MKFFIEDKEDLINSVSLQLNSMGLEVPKVKKIKTTIPKQGRGVFKVKPKVFGVRLSAQDSALNSNLPKFILSCTDYLKKFTKEVGLFRKAGSLARQKNLRVKIEKGGNFDGSEPNDVASLMKQWLRELPEPLIPYYLHESLLRCQHLNERDHLVAILLICLFLPPIHLYTLKHLMCFLAGITANEKQNKMTAANLAMIMAPNIFLMGTNTIDQTSSNKMQQYTLVIKLLIKNAEKIGEVPSPLSTTLPSLPRTCELETNSPSDAVEPSPSMSRKNYLFRSIRKLVKQNSTPPLLGTDSKQLTTENIFNEVCKKNTSETKGNSNLFLARSSEDICKRSFGLLRKKEKKKPRMYNDCSPLTQSLGIESALEFPIDIDASTRDSATQESLLKNKSKSRSVFSLVHFDEKLLNVEGIEMTTFKTCVIDQNESIQAFPIPFTPSNLIQSETDILLEKLSTEDKEWLQQTEESNATILSKDVDEPEITVIQCSTPKPNDNVSYSSKTKSIKVFQSSCSPQTLQLFTEEYKKASEKIESSNSGEIEHSYVNKEKLDIENSSSIDLESSKLGDIEFSNKNVGSENMEIPRLKIRQRTFVVDPEQTLSSKTKVVDSRGNSKTVSGDLCGTNKVYKDPLQKKLCIASSYQNKAKRKNVLHNVSKPSHGSGKITKNTSPVRKAVLKNVKNNKVSKGSTKSNNVKKNNKEKKILPVSDHIEFKCVNVPIFANKENQSCTTPSIKHTDFSETKKTTPQNSFENSQRPLKRKSISTPPRKSNSKIPRLINSFEIPHSISFSEPSSSQLQKVHKNIKHTDTAKRPTRIPVKCDNNKKNFPSLHLSVNDSCFQTPNRNAMLSPNSIVWMSGNKYFESNSPEDQFNKKSSPEEDQFNKRESIAMILKSKQGHVQAKVHLYDDLIRETVESTESVPCHSTPTSNFNKRLSSSNQSLKFTPRNKTKLQSSKSISYSKNNGARGAPVQNREKIAAKCNTNPNMPSPIRSCSLKDVTNKSIGLNSSKNIQNTPVKSNNSSIFFDKNSVDTTETKKKLKRNSFSGNTSSKPMKKVSRSESTPGPRPPYYRVLSLKQESNHAR